MGFFFASSDVSSLVNPLFISCNEWIMESIGGIVYRMLSDSSILRL